MAKKAITAELVREFLNQASRKYEMLDSQKALEKTNGDFQKAENLLFEREMISKASSLVTYDRDELIVNQEKRNKMDDIRKCNRLWFKDVDAFSKEDLALLKLGFEKGYIPLGDMYGDHNQEWVKWKAALFAKLSENQE